MVRHRLSLLLLLLLLLWASLFLLLLMLLLSYSGIPRSLDQNGLPINERRATTKDFEHVDNRL